MRLTEISLRALLPPERGVKLFSDDALGGFGVRVSQGGSKSFVLTVGRSRDRITIGRYPIISLAEARAEARRILAERVLGKQRPQRMPLGEAVELFLSTHCAHKNRPGTMKETARILRKQYAPLHRKALGEIETRDITRVTDRLLDACLPGAASHAHTAIRTFLRWCVRRRLLPHSPIEGLEAPWRSVSRDRVLSDEELAAVLRRAAEAGVYGQFLQLLTYTGQRRGEVAALDAAWINRDERSITLPKHITKNGRAHQFPYGDAVAEVLAALPSEGLLFKARFSDKPLSGFSKMKAAFDRQCRLPPWTLHDLRRTFATGLQRLGVRIEVTEALLNHASGTRSGIVGVYQRHGYHEEMRAGMATILASG